MKITYLSLVLFSVALSTASAQTNAVPTSSTLTWEQKMEVIKLRREITYKRFAALSPHMAERYRQIAFQPIQTPPTQLTTENATSRAIQKEEIKRLISLQIPPFSPAPQATSTTSSRPVLNPPIQLRDKYHTSFLTDLHGPDVIARFDLNQDGILNSQERDLLRTELSNEQTQGSISKP